MTFVLRGLIALLFLLGLFHGSAAEAQVSSLLGGEREGLPIEIFAQDAIEWQQEQAVIVARGNARAVRGDVEVAADVLSAFYRESASGESEIWRLEASGDVKIATPTETAYAQQGIYDVDSGVLVLRTQGSEPVRVVSENGDLYAQEQMEYWEEKKMFVARGGARAMQGDRMVTADVLVAYLEQIGNGEERIQRVEAFDGVVIETPNERVSADHGVYRVEDGVASVLGAVKITRGANQLNGCRAEVNLATGISTLFGCAEGPQRGRQVEGLIQPQSANAGGADRQPSGGR